MGTVAGGVAIAGVAASALSTGVSVYGAMQQGQAQRAAADYQAQVAKNNAIAASQNSAAVQNQAEAKAVGDARIGALQVAQQRAALGANGVTVDSGSGLNVQEATVGNTALREQQDIYQGDLSSYGYLTQGNNFTAQAGLDTATGANAQAAGETQAFGSLLSGASQVASKWNSYLTTPTAPTAPRGSTLGGSP